MEGFQGRKEVNRPGAMDDVCDGGLEGVVGCFGEAEEGFVHGGGEGLDFWVVGGEGEMASGEGTGEARWGVGAADEAYYTGDGARGGEGGRAEVGKNVGTEGAGGAGEELGVLEDAGRKRRGHKR